MDKYIIQKAFHWTKSDEMEITSDNLIYGQIDNMHGCQCRSMNNQDKIRRKCHKVVELIKEIDLLNES